MKSRSVHATQSGYTSTKYRLKIEDDPSAEDSAEAGGRLLALLRDLVDQPVLLMCGPVSPQKVRLWHSGSCWVLEAEAEVHTPQS